MRLGLVADGDRWIVGLPSRLLYQYNYLGMAFFDAFLLTGRVHIRGLDFYDLRFVPLDLDNS